MHGAPIRSKVLFWSHLFACVIAGVDPAIHPLPKTFCEKMDPRVKPWRHAAAQGQAQRLSPRVTRVGERALNEHDGIMLLLIRQSVALRRRRQGQSLERAPRARGGTADTTVSEAVVARHGSSSLSERTNCPCGGIADAAVSKAAVFSRRAGSKSCSGHQFAGVAETQDAGRLNRPASLMHVGWTPTSRTNSRAPSSEEERCSYKAEVEIS